MRKQTTMKVYLTSAGKSLMKIGRGPQELEKMHTEEQTFYKSWKMKPLTLKK